MNEISVLSPATVANLVCGFDVLGLCLREPYDSMRVRLLGCKKVIIRTDDSYPIPLDPALNTAGAPLLAMLEEINDEIGFELSIEKKIKPGSGIGSSAASAAGAVVAANHLLGNRFSREEMVRFAMIGEKVASGVKHADNIAPCIYGGITLIRSIFPLDIVAIPFPTLFVTVVHPQIEVRTSDAREILRKEVLLKDAIRQWGNIAGLVAGFIKKDYELIGRSLEDYIIEPVRSMLIPGFEEVKKACKQQGALGGGIAGSGPSIFMLSREERTANSLKEIMEGIYKKMGLNHHAYVTTINEEGVRLLPSGGDQP
jgi:homoserine kinase